MARGQLFAHPCYRGFFTQYRIYSIVATLDYKSYKMVSKNEYKPRPWLQIALNIGYLRLWHAFAYYSSTFYVFGNPGNDVYTTTTVFRSS